MNNDQEFTVQQRGGDILKWARTVRGLSQSDIALFYGVCPRTILRKEQQKSTVSFDKLSQILNQLGLTYDEYFNKAP